MSDITTMEEMERLERVANRVFGRVSTLEARVAELERELAEARATIRVLASGPVGATPEKPAPIRRVILLGCRVRPQGGGGQT